ncbi:MAG TPA: electron transfer flavoprotein subunit alpha/FixB family protein [Vicinamibacterales bacterium]|nr:electron transfer flavoprotein subunit alpha/FixB family protein [Vicinamibacterales bacterium]
MILVIAEQRDGKLNRASWEAIAAAQALAGELPVKAAIIGGSVAALAAELASAGVAEVLTVEDPALASYTPDAHTIALRAVVESASPTFVLMPHTYQTRDCAPMLAARMGRALITDVTALSGTGKDAAFTRPIFQGKLAAQVKPLGEPPFFITVQIGAFRADAVRKGGNAPVTPVTVSIDAAAVRQKAEPPFQEAKQAVDLGQAERIVAVGRGIKSQEHIAIAEKLAAALGAELAASRPICDNGWLPMERQIGSSGQTVAPKLYLALGISGAIQHLVGMKGSRTIVAINKDAEAPIFEVADYGIVGDLFEIVPALIAELEKN